MISFLHIDLADSKSLVQGVPSEILQSVGVELAIFLTTAAVAVALKGSVLPSRCSAGPVPTTSDFAPAKPSKPKMIRKVASPREKLNAGSCLNESQPPRDRLQMIDAIMERASYRSSEALALYAQLRSSAQHLQLIEASSHRAVDFYSTLIQCAIRADRPHLIEQIFCDMTHANVPRPLELYESAMKLLAGKKQYQHALSVYELLRSEGLQPSSVTLSCLVSFTAELGEYDRALQFFEQLSSSATPSIRAYMTVLRVHGQRQDWLASKAILTDMLQRNVAVDSLVLNIALATGVAAGKTVGTTATLNEFKDYADVVSYNTVIKGYAHQKDVRTARDMLELMVSRGVKPNLITYNTVMDAAVRKGQVDDAWQVLGQMCEAGLRPDKFSCTILVKGLQSSSTPKQLSTVVDILMQALPRCEAALSSMMFRNIMEVAARLKCVKLMLHVFDLLRQHIKPSAAEYQPLLQALLQQGDSQQAANIWQNVLSDPTLKSVSLFTAIVDDFSRREQVDCMIGAFESLRCAVLTQVAGQDGKPGLPPYVGEKLLQDCRSALVRIASNKRQPGRALRNLLERASELSTL